MTLPVSHVMRPKVVFCEERTTLRKVAEMILKEEVGSILVARGEESIGIITNRDLIRAALRGLDFEKARADEVMSAPIETCHGDHDLDEVLKQFEESGRTRLVVMQDNKVVGIVKRSIAQRFKGVTGFYSFSAKTRSLPFRRGSGSTQG